MNIQASYVCDHLSSMAPKKPGRGQGGLASGRGSSSGTQAGGRASGATSRNAQVTTKGGKQVMKTLWLPNAKQPKSSRSGGRGQKCFNCGEFGHISAECPSGGFGPKCYNCGQFGHISSACQSPRIEQ